MTVTNAAARVARNTEIDAKASTLDLALGSIVLLKKRGKSSVKDIISPTSFRRLESSPSDGERWLRNAAKDGDLYAMEKLELRLLSGDCLRKLPAEGQGSLRKSTELGNPFVMKGLAANDIIRSLDMTSCK
jgi:hypothetical protein